MKKLLIIALVIALAVPAATSAVTGDSPFYGKWVGIEHHAVVRYSTQMHYVYIDGVSTTSFYMNLEFNHSKYSIEEMEPDGCEDNWGIVDDHIRVRTSGISFIDLYYDAETDTLRSDNPKVTFVRLP